MGFFSKLNGFHAAGEGPSASSLEKYGAPKMEHDAFTSFPDGK